jgi:enoyl-CoA hydratase/carnithine racemase
MSYAQGQAAKLAALPASSVRTTKQLMKAGQTTELQTRMAEESGHFIAMLASPEAKEAFTAFFEKRRPDFTKFS